MYRSNLLTYYKSFAIITFGTGLLLHTSRLIFGAEYFLDNILTLNNDKIFSIPMVFAAVFAWLALPTIDFREKWQKVVYTIIAIYISISVPVHVKSWMSQDLKQLEAFPENYSYFILPVILSMLLFTLFLKSKKTLSPEIVK